MADRLRIVRVEIYKVSGSKVVVCRMTSKEGDYFRLLDHEVPACVYVQDGRNRLDNH